MVDKESSNNFSITTSLSIIANILSIFRFLVKFVSLCYFQETLGRRTVKLYEFNSAVKTYDKAKPLKKQAVSHNNNLFRGCRFLVNILRLARGNKINLISSFAMLATTLSWKSLINSA